MARKKSPFTAEYKKNRRRIQSAIRSLKKRGYEVSENILPSIPKRITAGSVRRLQKITMETLYKKSSAIDYETGEILSGKKARELEKQKRKEERLLRKRFSEPEPEIPAYADLVISGFKYSVVDKFPNSAGPIILNWLNGLLSRYDKEDVADMLQKGAEDGLFIDHKVAYNNTKLLAMISRFMDFLEGASTGSKQEIMDMLEYEEDWELPI